MDTPEGRDRAEVPPAANAWPWDRKERARTEIPAAANVWPWEQIGLGGWVRRTARGMIGLGLVVALIWDAIDTSSTVDRAIAAGASAIQVIQLYTPHVYTAIVAIGIAFGLYVITRGWDRVS